MILRILRFYKTFFIKYLNNYKNMALELLEYVEFL